MAQSFLEKVNTLLSANLHGMVDNALEKNSVKVMDEYIRQAERNLDSLEDSAATIGGTVRTLKRKYDEFAAAAEKLDRDIDTLLLKGKTELAAAAQADLNTKQQLAQEYTNSGRGQEDQYRKMMDMKLKLEAKLTTIRQEREQVKALLELAEAKRVTTKTIKSLDDLAGTGDEDVSRVVDAIRSRLDREDAQLEMATGRLSEQIEEAVGYSEVEMQLEERRRRLNLFPSGGAGSADSGSGTNSGATQS